MNWRKQLYKTVAAYIERDINHTYRVMFINWWHMFSDEILNEFEEVLDATKETARGEALREAYVAISQDANIDNDHADVARALHHLEVLQAESQQEVDYENPSREDLEREFPVEEGVDQ